MWKEDVHANRLVNTKVLNEAFPASVSHIVVAVPSGQTISCEPGRLMLLTPVHKPIWFPHVAGKVFSLCHIKSKHMAAWVLCACYTRCMTLEGAKRIWGCTTFGQTPHNFEHKSRWWEEMRSYVPICLQGSRLHINFNLKYQLMVIFLFSVNKNIMKWDWKLWQ